MLVKLVKKHEAARDYIDGGMERMLEKGLRTADQEQTLASKNTIVVLASCAAVHELADRMSALGGVKKCVQCMNQMLDLSVSVVQLVFRYRRYIQKLCHRYPPAVRARTKALMMQKLLK